MLFDEASIIELSNQMSQLAEWRRQDGGVTGAIPGLRSTPFYSLLKEQLSSAFGSWLHAQSKKTNWLPRPTQRRCVSSSSMQRQRAGCSCGEHVPSRPAAEASCSCSWRTVNGVVRASCKDERPQMWADWVPLLWQLKKE